MTTPYAVKAERYWKTFLPQEYAQIPDRERFFNQLGERIEEEVLERMEELQEEVNSTTTGFAARYPAQMAARAQAEREVLERMLPTPETDQD